MEHVEAWVENHLAGEDSTNMPERPLSNRLAQLTLNSLRPLVQGLAKQTKPGDILVFCPTGPLHRVPLHGIILSGDKIPLIERNPIVYTQSSSLLLYCHKSFATKNDNDVVHAAIFNTLKEDLSTASNDFDIPAEMIPSCEILDTNKLTNNRKKIFGEACKKSNIVNIYGHSEFDQKLEGDTGAPFQYLELLEPSTGPDDELSLNDIFTSIRFRKPSIVLAMGCRTSRSKISETDDSLGLTAAFHTSSAGAVVGAQWKIWREDAKRFTQIFYRELVRELISEDGKVEVDKQNEDDKSGKPTEVKNVVDLAKAYQTAVLEIRKDKDGLNRAPYHWAGFVLNGAWLFPKMHLAERIG